MHSHAVIVADARLLYLHAHDFVPGQGVRRLSDSGGAGAVRVVSATPTLT